MLQNLNQVVVRPVGQEIGNINDIRELYFDLYGKGNG